MSPLSASRPQQKRLPPVRDLYFALLDIVFSIPITRVDCPRSQHVRARPLPALRPDAGTVVP